MSGIHTLVDLRLYMFSLSESVLHGLNEHRMYGVKRRTVYALTTGLLLCLFPDLRSK